MSSRSKSLGAGLLFILIWQSLFIFIPQLASSEFSIKASSGMHAHFSKFFYFYKYLDLFPLATELDDSQIIDSRLGAEKLIAENPESLIMEIKHTVRAGDLGKIFLFIPSGWFKGGLNPTVHGVTAPLLLAGLMLLYFQFWRAKQTLLGFIVTLCLGSTTILTYEAYQHENIFSLPISSAILLLALHFSLIKNLQMNFTRVIFLAVFSGVLIGFLQNVRIENLLISISLCCLYIFNQRLRWWKNLIVAGVFVLTLVVTSCSILNFLNQKYDETQKFTEIIGGHPFKGPRHSTHNFWHAIYCGLGDFDRKYGYKWSDRSAAEYAASILLNKYNIEMPKLINCCQSNQYHDDAYKYYQRPYEMPEYGEVIREKVLMDIKGDPFWYLNILIMRLGRLLFYSSGISPFLGLFFAIPIPLVFSVYWSSHLYKERNWFLLRFIWFPLPLAGVAMAVYSGMGTTYYQFCNILGFAVFVHWYFENRLKFKLKKTYLKVLDAKR